LQGPKAPARERIERRDGDGRLQRSEVIPDYDTLVALAKCWVDGDEVADFENRMTIERAQARSGMNVAIEVSADTC